MNIIIDGNKIKTRAQLHDAMQPLAAMDGQYGRNLDALNDILGCADAQITLLNTSAFKNNFGDYADMVIEILKNAEEDNELLSVSFR